MSKKNRCNICGGQGTTLVHGYWYCVTCNIQHQKCEEQRRNTVYALKKKGEDTISMFWWGK